ncbi:MAG: hypothetical protein KAR14_11870, partial [Candidatus Aminicenantes bacterium]|nr:hypothetical protein [Candidatus Aminicenantes bacterium]
MKKTIFIAISIFCIFISISASVKMIGSPSDLEVLTINCHTDYSIIIEFPKKVTIGKVMIDGMAKSLWSVDHDLNLMWAQPEQIDSPDCIVVVETGQYDQIKLRLRVEKDPKELIHTIVLKESVFSMKHIQEESGKKVIPIMKENKNMQSENEENNSKVKASDFNVQENSGSNLSSINEKNGAKKEIRSNELEIKSKKSLFDFDTFFSLTGGTQSFADSSFAMEGEIIVAAKNESGLFFQGAGKTLINSMLKEYGLSIGAGFEPGKLGFFLFGDLLMHKFGEEFNSTMHWQIRPSARYRLSDKVHVAAFAAIPLGAWRYSGVEVIGNPGFGYYNKSLFHAGLDLSVYLKKMYADLRVLIAEGSAFGVDLKAGYELIKKIFVTLNYSYATTGDYTYMEG